MAAEKDAKGEVFGDGQVRLERPSDSVARVVMTRPQHRNAQGLKMTYGLDAAFKRAAHDDAVKVIILAGEGAHFSAGHDVSMTERNKLEDYDPVGLWGGFGGEGWSGYYAREKEIYLDMTERWRNLPKPTIAEVQGKCIAGGLMLAWACDLIIASDDAEFMDNTVAMGICGVEFFNHPFEVGVRKAKEWLFTGELMSAQEAHQRGMVNRVVPRDELAERTLELANKIASKPRFALRLSKEVLNASQDLAGRRNLMSTSFALHHVCHMNNMLTEGFLVDSSAFPEPIKRLLDRYKQEHRDRPTSEFVQMQRLDLDT